MACNNLHYNNTNTDIRVYKCKNKLGQAVDKNERKKYQVNQTKDITIDTRGGELS